MPEVSQHPNLVLIITDQERAPMYWPEGFVDEHMPSRARLMRHGVDFTQATCNTAMCSPSRATFMTGLMPAQHRVIDTLTSDGPFSSTETVLSPQLPNLASMLRSGGYDVQYRGKWHLSKSASGGADVSAEEIAAYGFDGWIGPDAGFDTRSENFGGGRADHDAHYIAQALDCLEKLATDKRNSPFCLVISLVNPHDVLGFPSEWEDDYGLPDFDGPVELPPTVDEDLAATLKPSAHAAMLRAIDAILGPLAMLEERRRYVNFYANLAARIDRQIAPLIDRFYADDGTPTKLGEDTIIVRFSDHGELAMSHGGLRQKAFNVYEETLRVPLIVSNPRLCAEGRACEHLASLIDLMPTLATLLHVEPPPGLGGSDLSPLLLDPDSEPVHEEVLFTFDDMHAGSGRVREAVPAAGRIRCIREARFKYARYFHAEGSYPTEYEMYDRQQDPHELENLAHPDHPGYQDPTVVAERERLAAKLAQIEDRLARPARADRQAGTRVDG